MSSKQRIGLVLNTQTAYGAEVVEGILAHARLRERWVIHPTLLSFEGERELIAWRPTGLLGRMECDAMLAPLRRLRVPIVDIDGWEWGRGVSSIATDDEAVGRLAARHFLQRGFRNFAFCGIPDRRYSNERQAGFQAELKRAGRPCGGFQLRGLRWNAFTGSPRRTYSGRRELSRWLGGLPRPAAVFACEDIVAAWLVEMCGEQGLAVPEEAAILGVGNETALCRLTTPAISSIPRPARALGYAAARLLDRLLSGGRLPGRPIRIAPPPVIARASTGSFAVEDADVRRVLQFIQDHAHEPLGVAQILGEVPLSRRALEMRFKATLGRTIRQEIQRVQMERARSLLVETDLDMPRIAQACGYANPAWFAAAFRKAHGTPPSAFRRQSRMGQATV